MQIPKIFVSSVNPQQLGLTVKAALVALVPLVLIITGMTNVNLGQEDLTAIVDGIVNVVVAVSTALSVIMAFVGIIRKIGVKLGLIKPQA